jgi:hypothetical protein
MGTGLLFDFARHHSTGYKLNRKYFDTYEKNDDDFPDLFNAMGPHKMDGLESLFPIAIIGFVTLVTICLISGSKGR